MKKILTNLLISSLLLSGVPFAQAYTVSSWTGTCVTTGYYSPLPGQDFYVMGSYDADRKMNGNGTNGADGTQVYEGMFAAPKDLPFGTQIYIPGLGLGTVHDRGGAIISYETEGEKIIRVDIWMGRGEEGLSRALNWGKRTHLCTYYLPDTEVYSEHQVTDLNLPAATALPKNQNPLNEQIWVEKLQAALKDLGYYEGEMTGKFDDLTRASLIKFQVDNNVVDSENSWGAGNYGTLTQVALRQHLEGVTESILSEAHKDKLLGLVAGAEGDEVTILQKALNEAGVFNYAFTTSFGPVTAKAVKDFQVEYGLTPTGEVDESTLDKLYDAVQGLVSRIPEAVGAAVKVLLKQGDRGDEVEELQRKLKTAGFFSYPYITDNFGQVTAEAVLAFQLAKGVIKTPNDPGAGQLTDKTLSALERFLKYADDYIVLSDETPTVQRALIPVAQAEEFGLIALSGVSPKLQLLDEDYVFEEDLVYGDQGEEVLMLQNKLVNEGYYDGPGTYGTLTRLAVCEYQKDHGLVASCADEGAGEVNEPMRILLNQ
ncbi:MAG: peptidoglycan-binding protein [Candidatus Gracilibacteria bacterium]|nr:peptidoglycan-binding protein [Candidatus Gracilibacteria bacterium]